MVVLNAPSLTQMYEPVKNYADKLFIWSDPDNAAWSSLTTVLETRQTAMGTGYPPFNSTGNPPMTLVFNDSCKCGVTQGVFWIPDSSNFADAFLWPYLDGYGNWTECQSLGLAVQIS